MPPARIKPLDGLASQAGSSAVILGASLVGAPVSTTHVVASSVVGIESVPIRLPYRKGLFR